MNRPTVLREALLDLDLLDAIPGLSAALARNDLLDDGPPAGSVDRDPPHHNATQTDPHRPAPPTSTGDTMAQGTSDDNDQLRQRERIERAEDEATAARSRVRLEEDQRVQESLRLAGYDAPVSERTRPATPRVSD